MVKIVYKSGFVDLRKGRGWVALLRPTPEGYIERVFLPIAKIWGKGGFVFTFEADLPVGSVLEISEGGSWRNQYRNFAVVGPDGELEFIGAYDSIKAKERVADLLGLKAPIFKPKS